jgi:AraC-like DNA-binding protein
MGMLSDFKVKSAAEQRAEARLGKPVEDVIRDGIAAGLTFGAIAKELGVSRQTLDRWMADRGLRVRRVIEEVP